MSSENPEVVLSVEDVSKCFEIYEKPAHRLYQTLCAGKKKFYREFWALRGVSFDVRRGECVGVIGKNGAGKSTLLQIITGILAPTSGSVKLKGRVAALLELGSGFNPEFTGRENVYLNGTILGLSKQEIDRRYDDILAFADIGEFINRPVKTYSSGMVVRLAFAVNAFVDAKVLIVDEALAVGDIRFQQKCLRRINALLAEGCTILLVSHDYGAVTRFCDRGVWIDGGRIRQLGDAESVVRDYLSFMDSGEGCGSAVWSGVGPSASIRAMDEVKWISTERCSGYGEGGAVISRVALVDSRTKANAVQLEGGEVLELHEQVEVVRSIKRPVLGFTMKDRFGVTILETNTDVVGLTVPAMTAASRRHFVLTFRLPKIRNGEFTISVAIAEGATESYRQQHWVHDAIVVVVANSLPSRKLGSLLFADDLKVREV